MGARPGRVQSYWQNIVVKQRIYSKSVNRKQCVVNGLLSSLYQLLKAIYWRQEDRLLTSGNGTVVHIFLHIKRFFDVQAVTMHLSNNGMISHPTKKEHLRCLSHPRTTTTSVRIEPTVTHWKTNTLSSLCIGSGPESSAVKMLSLMMLEAYHTLSRLFLYSNDDWTAFECRTVGSILTDVGWWCLYGEEDTSDSEWVSWEVKLWHPPPPPMKCLQVEEALCR